MPEAARARIVGRVTRDPETATTMGGETVCRLMVARKARGPASADVVVGLYVKGELARRCGRGLGEGDLVEGVGDLGAMRRGARFPEVLVEDVKLREAVSGRAATA
jgi:hypothetical protein